MKIYCNADGLESAIRDAVKEMKDSGSDGFDYKIGEILGMNLRITAEPDVGCAEIITCTELTYNAVVVED